MLDASTELRAVYAHCGMARALRSCRAMPQDVYRLSYESPEAEANEPGDLVDMFHLVGPLSSGAVPDERRELAGEAIHRELVRISAEGWLQWRFNSEDLAEAVGETLLGLVRRAANRAEPEASSYGRPAPFGAAGFGPRTVKEVRSFLRRSMHNNALDIATRHHREIILSDPKEWGDRRWDPESLVLFADACAEFDAARHHVFAELLPTLGSTHRCSILELRHISENQTTFAEIVALEAESGDGNRIRARDRLYARYSRALKKLGAARDQRVSRGEMDESQAKAVDIVIEHIRLRHAASEAPEPGATPRWPDSQHSSPCAHWQGPVRVETPNPERTWALLPPGVVGALRRKDVAFMVSEEAPRAI